MADSTFHWKWMKETHPDLFEQTSEWRKSIGDCSSLTPKEQELIKLSVAATLHCRPAVRSHTEAALKQNATEDDVFSALTIVLMVAGISAYRDACLFIEDIIESHRKQQ